MRGRVLISELHRVFEPKRGNISERTTLLLIRQPSAATCPYPLCPCGTFPPDRGNLPLKGKAFGCAIRPYPAPREIPRRGRNPFLVGQRIVKGRFRPHKLHIPRPAASGRSRSLRCSSSPNCVRSAGTQFGSFSFKDAASSSTQKRPRDSSRGRCLHSLINSSACRKSSSSSAASPPTRRLQTAAAAPSAFA